MVGNTWIERGLKELKQLWQIASLSYLVKAQTVVMPTKLV